MAYTGMLAAVCIHDLLTVYLSPPLLPVFAVACGTVGTYETADVLDMQWLGYGVVNADAF